MFESPRMKVLTPKNVYKKIVVGSVEKEIRAITFELLFNSLHLRYILFYIKNSKYPHSIYHLQAINYISLFRTFSQYYFGNNNI